MSGSTGDVPKAEADPDDHTPIEGGCALKAPDRSGPSAALGLMLGALGLCSLRKRAAPRPTTGRRSRP
jgi:hypothetical protein